MNGTKTRLALFPGSFDPLTYGHLDVLNRALHVFDTVEVTIAVNARKRSLFDIDERCRLARASIAETERITVVPFEGLLVDHAEKRGAVALIRGLRQAGDFDYEARMAFANRKLAPQLQTVFFMTGEEHALTSSSIVREIIRWGGDVSRFVPPPVKDALNRKMNETGFSDGI